MWESRVAVIRKKPKIILDNAQFPVAAGLSLGDKGQLQMQVSVDAERLEFQEDDVERVIKTVRVLNIKLLENKPVRI